MSQVTTRLWLITNITSPVEIQKTWTTLKLCKNREEFYEIKLTQLKSITMNQERKKIQPRLRVNTEET